VTGLLATIPAPHFVLYQAMAQRGSSSNGANGGGSGKVVLGLAIGTAYTRAATAPVLSMYVVTLRRRGMDGWMELIDVECLKGLIDRWID
jgi:hypothetical protein